MDDIALVAAPDVADKFCEALRHNLSEAGKEHNEDQSLYGVGHGR